MEVDNRAAAVFMLLGMAFLILTAVTAFSHTAGILLIHGVEWASAFGEWFLSISPWRQYSFAIGLGLLLVLIGEGIRRVDERWWSE